MTFVSANLVVVLVWVWGVGFMRTYLAALGLITASIVLSSCAAYQPLGTSFIRADGQEVEGEKLASDRSACADAGEKLETCMSEKGYALVRDDEVAAKQKEFADLAEKKKREQAALAAAEKKKKQAALNRAKKKQHAQVAAPAPANAQPASGVPAQPWPSNPPQGATNAQSSPWPQYNTPAAEPKN